MGVFLIWVLTVKRVVNYRETEREAMGDKEMSWASSIPFVKIMVQGIIKNPIELCNNSPLDKDKLMGQHTWLFSIDKEKVTEQNDPREWHKQYTLLI